MPAFNLQAPYKPSGDQPQAIKELVAGVKDNLRRQTLLGVTGSGKTASAAFTIQETNMPALIISHNKTLAAQLTEEFKEFFPNNAVEYFVSYYDYYQPEAYIPRTDTYIAKDASINDEIDRLRHAAMEAILTRKDVIVVSSVSCIYGLGSPSEYLEARLELRKGLQISRRDVLKKLATLQYERNDTDLTRGKFRVRGDVLDIRPASEDHIVRVEFFGNDIDRVQKLDSLTGELIEEPDVALIFPATFFMTNDEKKFAALGQIRAELAQRVTQLKKHNKLVEAQRLEQRITYDLEMIEQLGYVSGIENYSRHLDGRVAGEPPSTLLDFFVYHFGKDGFLTFIDESHMTIPQIGAMHAGDAARKKSLIEHGFRLPSAKDNRPLQFHEFEDRIGQTIFVTATPADFERNTSDKIVEQIVRPTGLLDPTIEIRPTEHQVDNVIDEIRDRIEKTKGDGSRVLVTTLTKRMAEELSTYLTEIGMKAAYIHSDVDTLERLEILRKLRQGIYDVLVGINLLREGLDLPEVSLVAIMDADKEGYLRSRTALVQIMGRAARHVEGHVIMYADRTTGSMKEAIEETQRRREIQKKYNEDHGITPQSIVKAIRFGVVAKNKQDDGEKDFTKEWADDVLEEEVPRVLKELTTKMQLAAQNLDFEEAARLRDGITKLRNRKK